MMSEVLAYVQDQGVLLTGLVNEQIVRTAAMMNMYCIIMVRGKQPTDNMKEMAEDNDLVLLTTELTMYETSGILYTNGLKLLQGIPMSELVVNSITTLTEMTSRRPERPP